MIGAKNYLETIKIKHIIILIVHLTNDVTCDLNLLLKMQQIYSHKKDAKFISFTCTIQYINWYE